MSDGVVQILVAVAFAAVAAGLAIRLRLGLGREIVVAAVRAVVQLALVGAVIAAVFRFPALSVAFVAAMVVASALTAGSRLRGLRRPRLGAAVAIAPPALVATGVLVLTGAFDATPRAIVPTAGILLGGAMAAATLTGRRMLEGVRDELDAIETRLALGDDVRTALAPVLRTAVVTGLVPAIDQTRSVGLVTLPGTFVGLVLGGASPAEAARTQLVVLLALLLVELVAALLMAEAVSRAATAPGERVVPPPPDGRPRRG
ncbi:ABC transporter permease [Patulibacter sp.]|uniref:ABC transporter permease n=1 Tax=Patulibacter sp. TaxID=1912859 RepID=UPI002722A48E|nr:ABC transporter permease [Patulibacter sp.]MDO9407912.1 ABC transporter permease [Patulibacter sp.]